MYRSTLLLDGGPVTPRYAGTRERYCLKDDGSISEVRGGAAGETDENRMTACCSIRCKPLAYAWF